MSLERTRKNEEKYEKQESVDCTPIPEREGWRHTSVILEGCWRQAVYQSSSTINVLVTFLLLLISRGISTFWSALCSDIKGPTLSKQT